MAVPTWTANIPEEYSAIDYTEYLRDMEQFKINPTQEELANLMFKAGYMGRGTPEQITKMKTTGSKPMGVDNDIQEIRHRLKSKHHKLEEVSLYQKPDQKITVARLKYSGQYYDIEITDMMIMNMKTDIPTSITALLDDFIDQNILGLKPKKKRNPLSKKQRDLKKAWVL